LKNRFPLFFVLLSLHECELCEFLHERRREFAESAHRCGDCRPIARDQFDREIGSFSVRRCRFATSDPGRNRSVLIHRCDRQLDYRVLAQLPFAHGVRWERNRVTGWSASRCVIPPEKHPVVAAIALAHRNPAFSPQSQTLTLDLAAHCSRRGQIGVFLEHKTYRGTPGGERVTVGDKPGSLLKLPPVGTAPGDPTPAQADTDAAWQLFFNALTEEQARQRATVTGPAELAEPLFRARSVIV